MVSRKEGNAGAQADRRSAARAAVRSRGPGRLRPAHPAVGNDRAAPRRADRAALATVDLEAGVLHVQQSAQRILGQGIVFRQPKTAAGRRAVALSPDTVSLLRRHRRRQNEARLLAAGAYVDRDLLFANGLGGALEPGTIRRAWLRIRREAGLPALRFHDLRHAHATLLLSQGVHPKVVSERLGHASIGITLKTYSHVLPRLQASAAAGLDVLFQEAETPEGATGSG